MKYLVLQMCLVVAGYGQQIGVNAFRDSDGKHLLLDSIRIQYPDRQFDRTTTSPIINLPDVVSVHDDASGSSAAYLTDIFDIQGRLIATNYKTGLTAPLQWHEQFGLVLVRRKAASPFEVNPKAQSISEAGSVFHVTAWRKGYVVHERTIQIPRRDTILNLELTLLPWWHRVKSITLAARGPIASHYESFYTTSSSGGSWNRSHIGPFNISVTAAVTNWEVSGTRVHYSTPPEAWWDDLSATIDVDTVTGQVTRANISSRKFSSGVDFYHNGVTAMNLPAWGIDTPALLFISAVDSVASSCLTHFETISHSEQNDSRPWTTSESKVYRDACPPNGMNFSCRITLVQ